MLSAFFILFLAKVNDYPLVQGTLVRGKCIDASHSLDYHHDIPCSRVGAACCPMNTHCEAPGALHVHPDLENMFQEDLQHPRVVWGRLLPLHGSPRDGDWALPQRVGSGTGMPGLPCSTMEAA